MAKEADFVEVIKSFATDHRLRIRRDECGDPVIPGRRGHIYHGFDDGRLGAYLCLPSVRGTNYALKRLLAHGVRLKQRGSEEICVTFDPANSAQVRAVMKECRVKPIRIMSIRQKQALDKARERSHVNASR